MYFCSFFNPPFMPLGESSFGLFLFFGFDFALCLFVCFFWGGVLPVSFWASCGRFFYNRHKVSVCSENNHNISLGNFLCKKPLNSSSAFVFPFSKTLIYFWGTLSPSLQLCPVHGYALASFLFLLTNHSSPKAN